jgi:hypothetical protein
MQARLPISVGTLILKNAVEAITDPKPRSRQAAACKTVESIIRTGKLLIEAKAKLKHGDFIAMLRSDLPFKERTAQRLMCIARSPNLANASTWTYLPARLRTLNDLAALPGPTFDVKVASGEINPSMTRTQLRIETPRPVPSTLTSDEIRAHICPANAALLPKRSRKLAWINSSADEIAAALLADGSRKQFKTELNLTIEFLTVLHAALDQSEREQARQVVVPLRPSAPPGIAG